MTELTFDEWCRNRIEFLAFSVDGILTELKTVASTSPKRQNDRDALIRSCGAFLDALDKTLKGVS
jgi:hypothetical protein